MMWVLTHFLSDSELTAKSSEESSYKFSVCAQTFLAVGHRSVQEVLQSHSPSVCLLILQYYFP